MDVKLFSEIGINGIVGVAIFGWIFTQTPLPQQLVKPPKPARAAAVQDVGKRTDKIPSVTRTVPDDITIKIEPVTLQTPEQEPPAEQALTAASNVLEVTATSLKLRSEPTSQSELISVYQRGSTFERIGQTGKWVQVRSTDDGASGWMFADYLKAAN